MISVTRLGNRGLEWVQARIKRNRIQLVIRADYDLQMELRRLQHEIGADDIGQVIECGLHALDRMVDERNRGAAIAFLQKDLEVVPFTPDYLYGKDTDHVHP